MGRFWKSVQTFSLSCAISGEAQSSVSSETILRLCTDRLRSRGGDYYTRACDRGGIGRRASLRSWWGNPWGFESLRSHSGDLGLGVRDSGLPWTRFSHSHAPVPNPEPLAPSIRFPAHA